MHKSIEALKEVATKNKTRRPIGLRNLNTTVFDTLPQAARGPKATGDIGLELEVEGERLPSDLDVSGLKYPAKSVWTATRDGSLRGESYEYVLSSPVKKEYFEEYVHLLFGLFEQRKTVLRNSDRTSTHVHLNVNRYKLHELTSFFCLWSIFEEAVVFWCGEDRMANHFCLTNKDTNYQKIWKAAVERGSFNFGERNRYSSLNLAAFPKFGSFEFRSMGGAESAESVIKWTKFLLSLQEMAFTRFRNPVSISNAISEVGVDNLFRQLCEGNEDFYQEVLDSVRELGEGQSFEHICFRGFRGIQDILYCIDWEDLLPEMEKEYVANPFETEKRGTRVTLGEEEHTLRAAVGMRAALERIERVNLPE